MALKKRTQINAAAFRATNRLRENTNRRLHTYETFDAHPVSAKKAGGAATGITGDRKSVV